MRSPASAFPETTSSMIWSKGTSREAKSPIASRSARNAVVMRPGHGDLDAAQVILGHRLARDDDRPVARAHARTVREQQVLVLDERIRVERDRRHLEPAFERPLVQRLDVAQDVLELEAARIDLALGEGPEHERVVGIRAVPEPDLHLSPRPKNQRSSGPRSSLRVNGRMCSGRPSSSETRSSSSRIPLACSSTSSSSSPSKT